MILKELLEQLNKIAKVHPEALDAQVWFNANHERKLSQIGYIGYDTQHKPARIKLED